MTQGPTEQPKTIGCSGTGHGDVEAKKAVPIFPKFPTALASADQIINALDIPDQKRLSILREDKGVGLYIDSLGIVPEQKISAAKLGPDGYLLITQRAALCSPNERPEVQYSAVGYRSYEAAAFRFVQRIRSAVDQGDEVNVAISGTSPLNIAESKFKLSPFAVNHTDGSSFSVMVKASTDPQSLMQILMDGRPLARQRIFDRLNPKALDALQSEELTLPAVPKKTNAAPRTVQFKPGDTDFQV